MKRRPQYQGQHDGASINRLDFTLPTQHVDVGLQMITARGLLIYWWYYSKMFTVNFCVTFFVNRKNSIGKKLVRLDWEKAIYQLVFTLANTLYITISSVQIWSGNFLRDRLFLWYKNVLDVNGQLGHAGSNIEPML